MKAIGIIPARYASTRFPGKPLVMIEGKSMIQRVFEKASSAITLNRVIVATDDMRISDHVKGFGGEVMITSADHPSGTDRIMEVIGKLENELHHYNIVVNIQGDEPFLQPEQIDQLTGCLNDPETGIATLARIINTREELLDPNCVKVIKDNRGFALYFSRQAIPFIRDYKDDEWIKHYDFLKHLGLYAYRTDVLKKITSLKQGRLEMAESLEQLRWLENGFKIKVIITDNESLSIDRPADLEKAIAFLNEKPVK